MLPLQPPVEKVKKRSISGSATVHSPFNLCVILTKYRKTTEVLKCYASILTNIVNILLFNHTKAVNLTPVYMRNCLL